MRAFVFPGQGAQYSGMGKDLYEAYPLAKQMFETANKILQFPISDIMFEGSDDDLRQTRVTQPAVFIHSVICCRVMTIQQPDMVAGHSLGEYSALVACGALRYEDALLLVSKRAQAMQKACEMQPSTMAAVLGLPDEQVSDICQRIHEHIVVAANFNCPGQVVISGTVEGVEEACRQLKAAGAKRALRLAVGGAFHSPLMQTAAEELKEAILATPFHTPTCPIYQNVNAYPQTNPEQIKQNLVLQLTAPVCWTQTVKNMVVDGATEFYEYGPGDVLKGLIRKINPEVQIG
ncbi:MAG: ACP S-malonyltransferase [Paludibacteraceae bacterium]|nr:ACP S-malonyltransferase [Paludibacteraceae bacterium]